MMIQNQAAGQLQLYLERVARTGSTIERAQSIDDLKAALLRYLTPAPSVVLPHPDSLPAEYAELFRRMLEEYPAQMAVGIDPEQVSRAEIGVSVADAGIIETGSLVLAQNELAARLSGMLTQAHCVILPENCLMSSLDELGSTIREWQAHGRRYVSVITGPSRSSDIERVLTIGVHGPKALHIIVGPAVESCTYQPE